MPSNKDFYDALTNLQLNAENVNLNVDQVETKLDTANGHLTTLSANAILLRDDVDDIRVDMANGVSVSGTVTANTNFEAEIGGSSQPNNGVQISFYDSSQSEFKAVADSTPLPISGTVTADSNRGNVTEASTKTITTGGTHQQVFASNANRKFLLVQNVSDTDMNLGIGYNPTASTGIFLGKNGSGVVFESSFIPTQEIRILCATTGKAFVALEG